MTPARCRGGLHGQHRRAGRPLAGGSLQRRGAPRPPRAAASSPPDTFERTERTILKRYAQRGSYDRGVVHAILDEAFVCHVGFLSEGKPFVIPTGYARVGETLYIHGSVGSHMLRTMSAGLTEVCVTVTLLDGLVLARSQFNTDMNYRCVVAFGVPRLVADPGEKAAALLALTEHIIRGRTQHARAASPRELAQTSVLALDLREVSAKVRTGTTKDDEGDLGLPVWAGVVPLTLRPGSAEADPLCAEQGHAVPEYIQPYTRQGW